MHVTVHAVRVYRRGRCRDSDLCDQKLKSSPFQLHYQCNIKHCRLYCELYRLEANVVSILRNWTKKGRLQWRSGWNFRRWARTNTRHPTGTRVRPERKSNLIGVYRGVLRCPKLGLWSYGIQLNSCWTNIYTSNCQTVCRHRFSGVPGMYVVFRKITL